MGDAQGLHARASSLVCGGCVSGFVSTRERTFTLHLSVASRHVASRRVASQMWRWRRIVPRLQHPDDGSRSARRPPCLPPTPTIRPS